MYEHLHAYRRVGNMYILLCLDNMFYSGLFSNQINIYLKTNCVNTPILKCWGDAGDLGHYLYIYIIILIDIIFCLVVVIQTFSPLNNIYRILEERGNVYNHL